MLGLAFLAVTIGVDHGDAPSAGTVRPAVVGQSTATVSTARWAGHEGAAAAVSDAPAPVAGQDRAPAGVPAFRYVPPAPVGLPDAPRTAAVAGDRAAPAPAGPRAPPLPAA